MLFRLVRVIRSRTALMTVVAGFMVFTGHSTPQAQNAARVAIDGNDIGGTVTGSSGPEAGVWVIAETAELGTKYRKIAVTDDQGRYVVPDLPAATYQVWVRGYGLVDSAKQSAKPGAQLNHRAVPAPDAAKAAQYFPANYWLSLLDVPPESAFPIGDVPHQSAWVQDAKSQIIRYQYGAALQRNMHPANPKYAALGLKTTADVLRYSEQAWQVPDFWPGRSPSVFNAYVDWIDRIRAGALPPTPPRPQGAERRLVITEWDVANDHAFVHDVASSDKRNPRVNPNGIVYGLEFHTDQLVILDPQRHTDRMIPLPFQTDRSRIPTFTQQTFQNPSPIFGNEVKIRDHGRANHLVMDEKGRVWVATRVNVPDTAEYCKETAGNAFAKWAPTTTVGLNIAVYDPKTEKWGTIRTCAGGNHLAMDVTGRNRVYQSGSNGMFGWVDIDTWDRTGDQEKSIGWCKLYFDGDKNAPVPGTPYGPAQSPDGTIWGAVQALPGRIVRLSLGANPPETCVGEAFEVPFTPSPGQNPSVVSGFFSRGIDVDSQGVVWTGLASSGHLASFDRRLCKGSLTGAEARTGRHCPEGWKLYPTPGPRLGSSAFTADFHYYNFIDTHDALGFGPDTPITNGTNSDSLLVLNKGTGQFTTLRVPYPLGFYTRGMDVRIDDPNAGWKGRALWATNSTRAVWHSELGPGDRGRVFKMQMRPDPLAH